MRHARELRIALGAGLVLAHGVSLALAGAPAGTPEESPATRGVRRALIVGIDDYQTGQTSAAGRGVRRFADLRGAVNDARAFREILLLRYGFAPEDVELLANEQATRDGILRAFRERLIARSGADDVAVFYYAGHGSQIRNSKNPTTQPFDQTLVPYDSGSGALDIWDKELLLLFNDLVDTGAEVAAFFDSCHSGSITRGLPAKTTARFAPEDGRDAAELYAFVPVDERPWPVSRGALIFSAAQDTQTAKETSGDGDEAHGIFSNALLRVLRTVPVDEPAQRVFQRTRAIMQSDGCSQEPVLGGILGDRDDPRALSRPLFGPAPEGRSGALALAVQAVVEDGIVLQGGRAIGLGVGTELAAVGAAGSKLEIERVSDLTSSVAKVVAGDGASIQPGDLFEIVHWVPPDEAHLRVWIPPVELTDEELAALARTVAELSRLDGIRIVADPALQTPTHVVRLGRDGWEVWGPTGATALGESLDVGAIEALAESAPVELFVDVPPPLGMTEALAFSNVVADSAVEVVTSPADAHYLLAGHFAKGAPEFCWALPNGSLAEDESRLALPVRTTWIAWPAEGDARTNAVLELREHALRTGRVRAWLRLEGPPADKGFPWRLALRDAASKEIQDGGTLHDGARIELVLVADELPRIPERRYVYVFALDCHGKSSLLFPPSGTGTGSNRFPPPSTEAPPERVHVLGSPVTVQPPFGTDTIVLLSTEEALSDPRALEWEAVLALDAESTMRGETKRGPLDRLLASALARTRSGRVGAPASWSISRMQIVTRPATTPASQDRRP